MTDKQDGGPAFPCRDKLNDWVRPDRTVDEGQHSGQSLREYAAIHLRVPDSGTPWLDDMIRQSLRQEFAKAALQGILHNYALAMRHISDPNIGIDFGNCAKQSVFAGVALLVELEKGGG